MNKLIRLEAGPVTGLSTQRGPSNERPRTGFTAEFGELAEVPQPPHLMASYLNKIVQGPCMGTGFLQPG